MVCPEGECAGQADGPALAGYLDGSRRCGKNILGHVASRSCWLYREDIRGHAETDGGTAGLRFLAQRTRSGELAASRIKMVRTACLVSPSGIEVFSRPSRISAETPVPVVRPSGRRRHRDWSRMSNARHLRFRTQAAAQLPYEIVLVQAIAAEMQGIGRSR